MERQVDGHYSSNITHHYADDTADIGHRAFSKFRLEERFLSRADGRRLPKMPLSRASSRDDQTPSKITTCRSRSNAASTLTKPTIPLHYAGLLAAAVVDNS